MTTDNPEQEARAAVVRAVKKASAHTDAKDGCAQCESIATALDLYGRERYLAGKVEALKRVAPLCAEPPDWLTCEDRLAAVIAAGGQGGLCQVHDQRQKYEAEYAACVAALQEAKHG